MTALSNLLHRTSCINIFCIPRTAIYTQPSTQTCQYQQPAYTNKSSTIRANLVQNNPVTMRHCPNPQRWEDVLLISAFIISPLLIACTIVALFTVMPIPMRRRLYRRSLIFAPLVLSVFLTYVRTFGLHIGPDFSVGPWFPTCRPGTTSTGHPSCYQRANMACEKERPCSFLARHEDIEHKWEEFLTFVLVHLIFNAMALFIMFSVHMFFK